MTTLSRSSTSLVIAFLAGTTVGTLLVGWLCRPKKKTAEEHLWQIVSHSFTGALLHAGDQLGIYDLLWKLGPVTPHQLAQETGWSERWLQEFLAQAAAAGICKYNRRDKTFTLPADYAALLRDPDNTDAPNSIAGMFQFLIPLLNRSSSVVQAIQTGVGVDYDWGLDVVRAIDRKNKNWFQNHLVNEVIAPTLVPSTGESLVQLLEEGVNVADVGVGCGASTFVLAKRFPKSRFFAYESSPRSIEIMRQRIETEKLTNIVVCNVAERSLGDGPGQDEGLFSFVYSHDVIHDMTQPRAFIDQVRKRLAPNGCWIIVDVDCHEELSRNIQMPGAALLYGFSCLLCLASATSTPSGQGLGTCGFPASMCHEWTRQAGFCYFEKRKIASAPMSSCFIVA